MNNRASRKPRWNRMPAIALTASVLVLAGCANQAPVFDASRFANARPLSSEKIFLGNDTIMVRGIGANRTKELDRYTCGPHGMMVCDSLASVAMCSCYRK